MRCSWPKTGSNFLSCGWVCHFNHFLKVLKLFKSLRSVWWMEDEWMTRLSSYYEHLVQPGRSVLGKRNYFGPKFVNWLTRLCATRTISSGVIRTQCVLQIPKACKEMSLSPTRCWRVRCVAHYILCILNNVWLALFALSRVRNEAT